MFHVEGVSKMEEGAATQPFLASFIILIHPLLPHCNGNFDTPSTATWNDNFSTSLLHHCV